MKGKRIVEKLQGIRFTLGQIASPEHTDTFDGFSGRIVNCITTPNTGGKTYDCLMESSKILFGGEGVSHARYIGERPIDRIRDLLRGVKNHLFFPLLYLSSNTFLTDFFASSR